MNVLVVVPTYNESENLPLLVPEVMARGYRMLIVDDDSPDGTAALAETLAASYPGRIEVMQRKGRPRGLGRSYVDGLKRALETDAEFICQMDADLSHNPAYLPALVAAAAAGDDVVIGSRYLHGVSVVNWPLHRIFLSTFANRYIKGVTRLSPSDCTSGYRCWRREALEKLQLDRVVTEGYAFLVEMLFEADRSGARISEVPIIFVERRQGQSKVSKKVLLESLIAPWRLKLRRRR